MRQIYELFSAFLMRKHQGTLLSYRQCLIIQGFIAQDFN
jgi:hypothetical protein